LVCETCEVNIDVSCVISPIVLISQIFQG
jgi:hypothetical protein